jgi:hypothetical protein
MFLSMTKGRPRAIGAGYYVVLSRILQVNFAEFLFHALRCIESAVVPGRAVGVDCPLCKRL